MTYLLVCDLDNTLSLSPPVVGTDYQGWERAIIACPPPVIEGAREGVRDLCGIATGALLLTARSERLRGATRRWVDEAFPILRSVEISMHPRPDTHYNGLESKLSRLRTWRSARGWAPIVLVDDDVGMRRAIEGRDKILIAPGCWQAEARAVAYALGARAA